MLKNRQNTTKIVKKSSKMLKNRQKSRKTVKIFEKTSKMLKNRPKTTKYVEKPLTNRQKYAKTLKKR